MAIENGGLVEMGACFRAHGIKGGFQFKLHNEEESVLKKKSKITIFPLKETSSVSKDGEEVEISNIHFGNKTVCYLKGITDRNIVEAMIPFQIFYPRERFPKLSSDEFYLSDIDGLDCVDTAGNKIGEVRGHYSNGAQYVLTLHLEGSGKVDLPFVEAFFPQVDLEAQTITVLIPEFDS